jgi:hypothetical protein
MRATAEFQNVITPSRVLVKIASWEDSTISASSLIRSSAAVRSLTSRTAADTSSPSLVSSGLRLISTGNSLPSRRKPHRSSPAPIGRTCRLAAYPAPAGRVICPEPPGHQNLHRPAEQLRTPVAEQRLGLRVDQLDRPGTIHDHHRIRRSLQQRTEPLLGIGPLACPDTAPLTSGAAPATTATSPRSNPTA